MVQVCDKVGSFIENECSLQANVVTAHAFCLHHATNNAKSPATKLLDLTAPTFCIGKMFSDSSFFSRFMNNVYDFLQLNLVWIQAA